MSVSDFFSINCPATKETKHIINKNTIKYFPNGAVISNSARGDMIDDEAMIEALKNGKIFWSFNNIFSDNIVFSNFGFTFCDLYRRNNW